MSLLMLRGHVLPRFGGARGTWKLALLITYSHVGLEDLRLGKLFQLKCIVIYLFIFYKSQGEQV